MKCPKCEVEFPGRPGDKCPRCGHRDDSAPPSRIGLPWDERREIGHVAGLWETAKLVLFSPTEAFRRMHTHRSVLIPWAYYLVMSFIVGVTNFVVLLFASRFKLVPSTIPVAQFVYYGAIGHLLALHVSAFLNAALLHAFLWLYRCKAQPFEATFALYCYSHGSVMPFKVLPIVGDGICLAYCPVLVARGIRTIHHTGPLKQLLILSWWVPVYFTSSVASTLVAFVMLLAA